MIFRRRRIRVELDYSALHIGSSPSASTPRDAGHIGVVCDVKAGPPAEPCSLPGEPERSADLASGTLIQNPCKEKSQ